MYAENRTDGVEWWVEQAMYSENRIHAQRMVVVARMGEGGSVRSTVK